MVRRQTLGKLSFAEACHAGRLGLWRAILGYDPQRGYAFSAYAYPAVARKIWRKVKETERSPANTEGLELSPRLDQRDPALVWETQLVQRSLYERVGRLPERLRQVIIARYGLDGKPPACYREIGGLLGLSREGARLLHLEALVWLRHPAHSQHLRSLLEYHTLEDYEFADQMAQRWLRRAGQGVMARTKLTPPQTRARDESFVNQCSLEGLRARLPLMWLTLPAVLPSPKKRYRSHYVYEGFEELNDWEDLSDLDLVLRLVDFSNLRPVLAQLLSWTSGRGRVPFDAVSVFLLVSWQLINKWERDDTLKKIGQSRYADYRRRFGFESDVLPIEGDIRYFLAPCLSGDPFAFRSLS